jgi:hypothetical protein
MQILYKSEDLKTNQNKINKSDMWTLYVSYTKFFHGLSRRLTRQEIRPIGYLNRDTLRPGNGSQTMGPFIILIDIIII